MSSTTSHLDHAPEDTGSSNVEFLSTNAASVGVEFKGDTEHDGEVLNAALEAYQVHDDAVAESCDHANEGTFTTMAGRSGVANDVLKTIKSILAQVEQDNQNRSDYTQNLCRTMRARYPDFNFVVCHVQHDHHWDGVNGVDWAHWHEEVDIQIGGTIGYEVYWARSGSFTRWGDGGFLNWAYQGNVASRSADGRTIVFAQP